MKKLLLFVLLSGGLNSWSQTDTTTYPQFTATQLQQDLDSIYLNLQWNHPHLFAYHSKADADAAFQQLRRQVSKSMNRIEFTRLVAPFIALFRDGHTSLDVDFESEEFNRYSSGGGRFFPLGVYILDGKLYAGRTDLVATAIRQGDEIISLNGIKSSAIIDRLQNMWSADGVEGVTVTAQRLFSYSLWTTYQWGTRVLVEYRSNGKEKKELLGGIGKEDFLRLSFNSGGTIRKLHLYPDYSLAVVEINSYGSVEKTNHFIDSCFAVIKQKGIRNVALDLRKNGGGNSYIGDYFIAHISQKPYNTVRAKKWHLSPMVLQLSNEHWLRQSVENAKKTYTRNGAFLESPQLNPQRGATLKDPALFVEGNLFLFTSPRTYSSAHMTALAVKCGGLGTIIGQPTGERLNLTGEILTYKAPNSGLKIVIPVAAYTTACGDGEQIGVQPDHFVKTTIEDIRAGRDPELLYLQQLLKNSGR
ncbi:MAG TPA: S41 family peptidase [Flavisolibacter sp.]|jgi:C-terminal processing protease CtpA/Prc|nr:S41 family peptidase [Flavisolibacter sp.]